MTMKGFVEMHRVEAVSSENAEMQDLWAGLWSFGFNSSLYMDRVNFIDEKFRFCDICWRKSIQINLTAKFKVIPVTMMINLEPNDDSGFSVTPEKIEEISNDH